MDGAVSSGERAAREVLAAEGANGEEVAQPRRKEPVAKRGVVVDDEHSHAAIFADRASKNGTGSHTRAYGQPPGARGSRSRSWGAP
jgi:hypothetical protein